MKVIVNWKRRFQALVLERGNRYYKENRVQNFRYEDEEYRAHIIGSASYNVEIKIKNDDIVFARCSCPHAAKGNYCKHMAALLYAIDDKGEAAKRQALERNATKIQPFQVSEDAYLKKYNPGDSTDLGGRMILNNFWSQYAKNVIADQMEQVMDFKLEPVLERDMDGLYVSFKAGVDKLYVLKNLRDFLDQYENQEEMPFGTKSEINRMSMHFYYEPHEIKNRIPLYGERLDTFYDIYEGQSIAFADKSGRKAVKSTITLKEGKPNIRLKIEKDMDQEQIFHGIKVKGSIPDFIMGDGYRYYFKKDAYHQMLPVLKRNLTVEETEKEEIAEYIPPEAEFLFYLDEEEGRILCRPRARYGEEEVSLIEHYKEDCVFQTFRNTSREEEILKMQESKHQLADEILSGETGSITQMSKDELLELFEGES